MNLHKVVVVTNGFDPEPFDAVAPTGPRSGPVRVVHTGELYSGRDPRPFLDALRGLVAEGRGVAASFLGRNTSGQFDLGREVADRGLEGVVHLGGQVTYQESLRDMAAADVLLLLDGEGRRIGVPAKLYEYLGAGKPVLALAEPDGDVAWVLRQSGLPYRIAPPGPDARHAGPIRSALEELVSLVEQGAARPDLVRLHQFTREALAQRFADLMEGCGVGSSLHEVAGPLAEPSRPVSLVR